MIKDFEEYRRGLSKRVHDLMKQEVKDDFTLSEKLLLKIEGSLIELSYHVEQSTPGENVSGDHSTYPPEKRHFRELIVDAHINRITEKVAKNFNSFGGGNFNPVVNALRDKFAAGVDIEEVVRFILDEFEKERAQR